MENAAISLIDKVINLPGGEYIIAGSILIAILSHATSLTKNKSSNTFLQGLIDAVNLVIGNYKENVNKTR